MTERSTDLARESFVTELDDVAEVLKAHRPGHEEHDGWSLRSGTGLTCACGEVLYAPGETQDDQPG